MAADAATSSPIEAIAVHHAEMEEELRRRVNDLVAVVSRGEPSDPAAAAVVDYLQTTILPHAASEDYVARRTAEGLSKKEIIRRGDAVRGGRAVRAPAD